LQRTFILEAWLRHLTFHGVLTVCGNQMHSHSCGRQGNAHGPYPVRPRSDTFAREKYDPSKLRGPAL
jgi:hypothetical protein